MNANRKDPQRGKSRATKSKRNVKVSTKVSTLKPQSGSQSLLPPGAMDTKGHPTFQLPGPPLLAALPSHSSSKLGVPPGSSWASAQDEHTHSQLPVNFTYFLTPDGNIHLLNIPRRGPAGTLNHPPRSKPIQRLHISSSLPRDSCQPLWALSYTPTVSGYQPRCSHGCSLSQQWLFSSPTASFRPTGLQRHPAPMGSHSCDAVSAHLLPRAGPGPGKVLNSNI